MSDLERRVRDVTGEFPRPDEQVTRHVERRVLALLPSLRVRSATALTVLALGAALSLGVVVGHWDATASRSGAGAVPVRSADVTLLCTTRDLGGGYREIKIGSSSRRRFPAHEVAGGVYVMDGIRSGTVLASASGDVPSRTRNGAFYYQRVRCSQSSARIPLRRVGLVGGATPSYAQYDCATGRRVLVRVRTSFRGAGRWRTFGRAQELRGIRQSVTAATIAVATHPGRRPLAYATLDASGNTRLFTAPRCTA